jgi:formamidopyrimidine-DNA glycosylase
VPELPEVETIRRQLEPRLQGAVIVAAASHPSAKFTPALAVQGAAVEGMGRRGKYLLVALDDDRELVIHLGMTGALDLVAAGGPGASDDDPYVRAWWLLADGRRLRFHDTRRFGRLRVVTAGDYRDIPTLAAMGPEPFSDQFTPSGLRRAVNASRRAVKTQLLSQRPVAGVGNIYADEACWLARVHPESTYLSAAAALALHHGICTALAAGLDDGGTMLRDYRSLDGATGEHQHHLHAYGRAGEPCERCGSALRSVVLDARTTTFCSHCQRRAHPRRAQR